VITLNNVTKTYTQDQTVFHAVDSVSLSVKSGEIYGIIGRSGAGKSTLLRMINLLEIPTSGSVIVDGMELTNLKGRKLRLARQSIGMIFQHFHLVTNKTVLANVLVSLELANYPEKRQEKACTGSVALCRAGGTCFEISRSAERRPETAGRNCESIGK